MPLPDFEVIVVGAGPAGAMMTLELTKRKFRVLCIEKSLEVGYTNKSTAATPIDTFMDFELPRSLGFADICGMRIYGPTVTHVANLGWTVGRVLQFRETKQYLIKEAIKLGAATLLGSTVTGVIRKDGWINGVTYRSAEGKGSVVADVVVDASGPEAILATNLGLWQKNPQELGVAFEYFLTNASPDKSAHGHFLDILMGSEVAPGGYAWIFPTSKNEVKAGICKLNPKFKVPSELTQKEYFQKLWEQNDQIKGAQPFEIHDCAHYITGGVKNAVLDHFLAVGDAVNKVNPLFGEGVRSAFYSARFAAQALTEARKRKDYSEKSLRFYDELWKRKWGTNWLFAKILFHLIYKANDRELDALIGSLKKFSPEALYKIYVGKASGKDYFDLVRQFPGAVNIATVSALLKNLVS